MNTCSYPTAAVRRAPSLLTVSLLMAGLLATSLPDSASTACLPTDIYVSDALAFGGNNGGVIRVEPVSGARSTLSENNNPVGGPDLETPSAMAFEAGGSLIVADPWGVVSINLQTGDRTSVSHNGAPAGGPDFSAPNGIAVEANGSILVADLSAFPQNNGGIIRVDPVTGDRTTVSRNGAPAGGPRFEGPWDLAVAANGDIIVVDSDLSGGKVIRVDPQTGARTLISKNSSPVGGPDFVWPWAVALDHNGDILVSDGQAFGGSGGIIRVDPVTGDRTTVSENAAPAGAPNFTFPADLVVTPCGEILITDLGPSGTGVDGAVLRVDPATGVRSKVSTNAAPAGVPDFAWPWGIAAK